MSIHIACGCGGRFRVPDQEAGHWVRCPECRATLGLPGPIPSGPSDTPEEPPTIRSDFSFRTPLWRPGSLSAR